MEAKKCYFNGITNSCYTHPLAIFAFENNFQLFVFAILLTIPFFCPDSIVTLYSNGEFKKVYIVLKTESVFRVSKVSKLSEIYAPWNVGPLL